MKKEQGKITQIVTGANNTQMKPTAYVESVNASKGKKQKGKLGKAKRGLTNGGLSPNFQRNRAKIFPGKSGLFGPDWSLFRAYRSLFGVDRHRFLRTSQLRGGGRNSTERAFLGPIGAFRAKPPFRFPQIKAKVRRQR